MANKFYAAGEERAARVDDLFATIARRYDLINDLQSFWLHRFWKRRLVALAHPAAGESALDVCCGTGDVAFALARRGAEVVGLDFSEAMLAMARARSDEQGPQSPTGAVTATRMGVRNPQFIRGDAQALPFPDAQFDLVTVSYGLRNLARWQTGLREMWRVAKPGGCPNLRLYSRITEPLPGATRGSRSDAQDQLSRCAPDPFARRSDEHQLRNQVIGGRGVMN